MVEDHHRPTVTHPDVHAHPGSAVGWGTMMVFLVSACLYPNPQFMPRDSASASDPAVSTGDAEMTTTAPEPPTSTPTTTDTTTDTTTTGTTTTGTTATTGPEPPSCDELECGLYASCNADGPEPMCVCNRGFVGDGVDCMAVDPCLPEVCAGVCHHVNDEPSCVYPQTCAQLRDLRPDLDDGDAELFVDGDPSKPWTAYCKDMAQDPREYLTLPKQDDLANIGRFVESDQKVVTSRYTKIRLIPGIKWWVDIGDTTFAETTGTATFAGNPVTSVAYGVAMTCNASQTSVTIDLRDTPFRVSSNFCGSGMNYIGETQSSDPQVYTNTGGGTCGWRSARAMVCPIIPLNGSGGENLGVAYDG